MHLHSDRNSVTVKCATAASTCVIILTHCIGNDTKADARQSPSCNEKTKRNKTWRKTIFNMADKILTPCNVACGSGIMTVSSPSGSTPQCDTWLRDDMTLNLPKRPPYWNSTSGFDFGHITADYGADVTLSTVAT